MAEKFESDWLGLRESADHSARDSQLTAAAADWLSGQRQVRLLDLGSGSGSNVRYLAPRLPGPQHWELLDHDSSLLSQAHSRCRLLKDSADQPIQLATHSVDLRDLGQVLQARHPIHLVSASALLDLVSRPWLEALADYCRSRAAAILVTLSYDGVFGLDEKHPDDDLVRTLVNAHQRRQKGFGPALGPDAAAVFAEVLRERGFRVSQAASPWRLDGGQAALAAALIEGWCNAALKQAPNRRETIEHWRAARLSAAESGNLVVSVGHQDLFAVPEWAVVVARR